MPVTVTLSVVAAVVVNEVEMIGAAVPPATAEVLTQVEPEVEPEILIEHFVPAVGAALIKSPSHSVIEEPAPNLECPPVTRHSAPAHKLRLWCPL
jgi:hypothetical protein